MARKTKEEAQRTRERILDAAVQVFSRRGVARSSLTDVAELIGMTRGAVYGHFRNKGELLVALFERERLPWESLAEACEEASRRDPLGVLRRALVRLLQHACANPARIQTLDILFYRVEIAVENEPLMQRIEAARHEARNHMVALLRRAMDAGQVPATRDPERDVRFLLCGIGGAMFEWLWEPAEFDLAAEAEALVDTLLQPIVGPEAARSASARARSVAELGPQGA